MTIDTIQPKGPFLLDTSISGEGKRDGVVPIHPAVIQVSAKRWVVFFSTLDLNGWDAVKSILYQVRADAADGPVLKEGVVASSVENWDPLGRGDRFSKRCGTPVAFGVPKGARRNGKRMETSNVFVFRWYRYAHLRLAGALLNPLVGQGRAKWPEGLTIFTRTMRLEWVQFRLNDEESDIELLQSVRMLRQRGYDSDRHFCSLGADCAMFPALTPSVPMDEQCLEWVEFDAFATIGKDGNLTQRVAPVRYRFNKSSGLYEWVETGKPFCPPGRSVGEASILRYKNSYLIALREFGGKQATGTTVWLRTHDPFGKLEQEQYSPTDRGPRESPRTVYLCPDGVIRMFGNENALGVWGRNPLYCWEIDPETFAFTKRRLVFDARTASVSLKDPFVDMPKLVAPEGNRQLLVFRVIASRHTVNEIKNETVKGEDEMAGLYSAEIRYRGRVSSPWKF